MDQDTLERALLCAHDAGDTEKLIDLYTLAGDQAEQHGDVDAACFFFTHAFVFALESGATEAVQLNTRLTDYGRAHPLQF